MGFFATTERRLAEAAVAAGFSARNLLYSQGLFDAAQRYAEAISALAERSLGPHSDSALTAQLGLADVIRMQTGHYTGAAVA